MGRVVQAPSARTDLEYIGDYIARESRSRAVAIRFLDRIMDRCRVYANHPELGEVCPDFEGDIRRFPIGNYVVFYRPIADGIEVLRVLHGSRDIPAIWRSRFDDD